MERHCNVLVCLVLVAILSLGACTPVTSVKTEATPTAVNQTSVGDQQPVPVTMEQVYSGLKYLSSSLNAIHSVLNVLKEHYPNKFSALYDKVAPVLEKVTILVDQATEAYGASDLTKTVSLYNLARPQLGTIVKIIQDQFGSNVYTWALGLIA